MQEQLLVSRAIKGDINAFGTLAELYAKMCFSIAYRVVKDYDHANDITQDALIAAFENIQKFKEQSKFSTWLYRIVFNKALSFKNKTTYAVDVTEVPREYLEEEEELHIDEKISPKIIKDALDSLNDIERMHIELFYYQEQSIRDISTICNISEVNTKVILHRARKKMKIYLTNVNFAVQ